MAGVDTNGLYTPESMNCFSKLPFYMQLFCDRYLDPLCAEAVALGFADDQYVRWGVLLVHGEEGMERIWHRLDTVGIALYKYLALNCIVVSFRAGWVSVVLTDLMNLRSIALHKCRLALPDCIVHCFIGALHMDKLQSIQCLVIPPVLERLASLPRWGCKGVMSFPSPSLTGWMIQETQS